MVLLFNLSRNVGKLMSSAFRASLVGFTSRSTHAWYLGSYAMALAGFLRMRGIVCAMLGRRWDFCLQPSTVHNWHPCAPTWVQKRRRGSSSLASSSGPHLSLHMSGCILPVHTLRVRHPSSLISHLPPETSVLLNLCSLSHAKLSPIISECDCVWQQELLEV